MKLIVNDKPVEMKDNSSLLELIDHMGASSARVAIMVNGEVISKSARDEKILKDNDCIELLTFAAGG